MNKTLAQDLANSLKSYSLAIEYWEPHAGDTFLYIGHRTFLQTHWTDLNAVQKTELAAVDKKVLGFVIQQYGTSTEDIEELHLIADIINGKSDKKAA